MLSKRAIIRSIILFLLLISFSTATHLSSGYAHKPLEASNNYSFSAATQIPNHKVSWAMYEELEGSDDADYYSFTAHKGERFNTELSIPKLQRFVGFEPSLALIGYGVNSTIFDERENLAVSGSERAAPFYVPPEMNIVITDYRGPIPSPTFYEPFTQTSYWQRQKIVIDHLPIDGKYYLVVFNQNLQNNGKYTLAVGEIEEFSPLDYVTTLPSAWFSTKIFFEDYLTPVIVISVLVTIPVLVSVFTLRHRRWT